MSATYRQIILHAGLGKTGTTSIQNNCYRQRALLLEQGIVYPSFRFRNKNLVNHSDCLIASFCDEPGKYGAAIRQEAEQDPTILQQEISPQMVDLLENPRADTLVLSGEAVAEYNDDDMQSLRDKLLAHTEQLRVVAYIRSPQSSLESILQQRVKTGHNVDLESLVSIVRDRYRQLRENFGSLLDVFNFHDAVGHPSGLVGHFMEQIGVPPDEISTLDFETNNERVTLEGFKIMAAVNQRYARKNEVNTGVVRRPFDLRALMEIPGKPFHLDEYASAELLRAAQDEGDRLAAELGFHFPAVKSKSVEPLWQEQTLLSLERVVRCLDNEKLEIAVADFLIEEAAALLQSRPETAGILHHIGWSLKNIKTAPSLALLEKLGADYFKFAALQLESNSTELAYTLMQLARELRPEAEFIESRLNKYKADLESVKGDAKKQA